MTEGEGDVVKLGGEACLSTGVNVYDVTNSWRRCQLLCFVKRGVGRHLLSCCSSIYCLIYYKFTFLKNVLYSNYFPSFFWCWPRKGYSIFSLSYNHILSYLFPPPQRYHFPLASPAIYIRDKAFPAQPFQNVPAKKKAKRQYPRREEFFGPLSILLSFRLFRHYLLWN